MMHFALVTIAWLIAFAWLYKLLEAAHGLRTLPNLLTSAYDSAPERGPLVAVIVPARNEAASVAACLESLIAQDYESLRIFGVDDRSTDQTGGIMDALAQACGARFEAIRITDLPPGWLGKTNAMALAARHAIATRNPDWLLFTDADVAFRQDALRRSLAEATASHADHFIVLPTAVAKTAGEALLLAYMQVVGMWAVRPWRVADPRAMRDALGVGAFNLVRSTAYQQLGGFDAMPMEILEDLTLGRRVKRAGLRQRVAIAPEMISLHWAVGLRGIVRGLTKNAFATFSFNPTLLLGAAVGISAVCLLPVAFLAVAGTRLPAAIALASIAGLYALTRRSTRISPLYAVLFPVGTAVAVYAMLRSMIVTLRDGGVTWRGTFYPLADLRRNVNNNAR
jgi:GT2 family glycosyltransferase